MFYLTRCEKKSVFTSKHLVFLIAESLHEDLQATAALKVRHLILTIALEISQKLLICIRSWKVDTQIIYRYNIRSLSNTSSCLGRDTGNYFGILYSEQILLFYTFIDCNNSSIGLFG